VILIEKFSDALPDQAREYTQLVLGERHSSRISVIGKKNVVLFFF
jgi:hypothetical protein